jgi:hypothetical protein
MTMAARWTILKEEIDKETARVWREEPEELKKLRLGIIENDAGSYGQYFTTWDFANGMIRDYSMYTLYPLLRLSLDPAFSLEHLKKMFKALDPQYTVYLGYSGYRTLERFGREFSESMDEMRSKDDFIHLLTSLLKYANKLAAWSFHYFPWGIGVLYPHRHATEVAEVMGQLKMSHKV